MFWTAVQLIKAFSGVSLFWKKKNFFCDKNIVRKLLLFWTTKQRLSSVPTDTQFQIVNRLVSTNCLWTNHNPNGRTRKLTKQPELWFRQQTNSPDVQRKKLFLFYRGNVVFVSCDKWTEWLTNGQNFQVKKGQIWNEGNMCSCVLNKSQTYIQSKLPRDKYM